MHNTKQSVMSNFIWRFAERCGAQIVMFVVSIVLARFLMPEHFGTVALITVITTILQVFVDSGLGTALIQKKDADDIDFSTVFYTNIVFCIIIYVGLYFISPLIAQFYNNLELIPYIKVLGLTIIISGIKNVQQSYVSRNLMFKKFFLATLVGTITAALVGIIMAINGFGVWSIIAQHLTNLMIDTIMLWITVKWRPIKAFSFKRLKILWSFGWKMLVASLIDAVYKDMQQLVIGKKYSSSDLGYYNQADQFPRVIVSNINSSIDSVLLPTMSNVQENKEKIKEMTRKSIKVSTFIMAPLMMGLAFCSNNIIDIVLTSKWLPCVPFMIVFCISYMFYPIHTANLNAIKAVGRSDLFLKLEIAKKLVGIVILLITMNISVMAMAYGFLVSNVIGQLINSWPNRKLLNYSYTEQLRDILPCIILAFFMGIIIYCYNFLSINIIVTLILQVISGAIIYILGAKIFKIDTFGYIIEVFSRKKGKNRIAVNS